MADKYDLFDPNKIYKAFHDHEFEGDYTLLAYQIQMGELDKAR